MSNLEESLKKLMREKQRSVDQLDEVERLIHAETEKESRVQRELDRLEKNYEAKKKKTEGEHTTHVDSLKDLEAKRVRLKGEIEYADRALEQTRGAIEHNQQESKK